MSYIDVQDLQKTFAVRKKRAKGSLFREKEHIQALCGLSFQIEQGELVGYIGPNGAGKSTTVKILSGILTPDGGKAVIGGLVPWEHRKEHVRRLGVVFGQRTQLWWDVPILDSFSLLKDIYRLSDAAWKQRLDELTEALQLKDLLTTPLRLLSLGQRMRAELCGSLLHRPELLFLDEPTIGLDSISKLALRDFLQWENRQYGTTILLTTHDMEDISALCRRVMVIGHGRKLFDGEFAKLLSRYDTKRTVLVRFREKVLPSDLPRSVTAERQDDGLKIVYSPAELPTPALLALLQQAGTIEEMTIQPQNIDHMIADMYQEMAL